MAKKEFIYRVDEAKKVVYIDETATPTDDTYFIRQDTGGGNTFGRVKFSTLWSYIKGKTDSIYAKVSHKK